MFDLEFLVSTLVRPTLGITFRSFESPGAANGLGETEDTSLY